MKEIVAGDFITFDIINSFIEEKLIVLGDYNKVYKINETFGTSDDGVFNKAEDVVEGTYIQGDDLPNDNFPNIIKGDMYINPPDRIDKWQDFFRKNFPEVSGEVYMGFKVSLIINGECLISAMYKISKESFKRKINLLYTQEMMGIMSESMKTKEKSLGSK